MIDLIGQRFGKLTVIRKVDKLKNTRSGIFWLCKCDCGNEKVVLSGNLRRGNTRSCGCLWRETVPKSSGYASFNAIYSGYRKRIENKGLLFNINKEEFKKITQENCYYCGEKPSNLYTGNNGNFIYNGIDRIDSSLGYINNNVVPCCFKCNSAKKKMSIKDFLLHIKKIYDNLENK